MSMTQKPVFKIVDEKGRITIPKAMREAHGIASGDVVTITAERGNVRIKKAVVLEVSATMIKCKKEAVKKCSFLAVWNDI